MYGELIPVGGGDPIPLLKSNLLVGRREHCDIVLRFGNISGQHCELTLDRGWWFVKDLNSQNGTLVNGLRVTKKRLDPGDRLTISRHDYEVKYLPSANGGDDLHPPEDDVYADIMGKSLLESAGLNRKQKQVGDGRVGLKRRGASAAAAAGAASEPGASEADAGNVRPERPADAPTSPQDDPTAQDDPIDDI